MVKNVKGVIWSNGAVLADLRKPPLRQGNVLGKVVTASVSHIEKLVSLGFIPTEVGTILGSAGVIKVIDVGSGLDSKIVGKHFLLLPRPGNVGGVNFDGVLAEVASIPHRLLIPISSYHASVPETLIYSELSYVHEIAKHVKNKDVLLLGCGPTSYVTVKYIKDLCNAYVACIQSNQIRHKIAELGVFIANYENVSEGVYDVVIVLATLPYIPSNILKIVRNAKLIIIPPTIPRTLINVLGLNYDVGALNFLVPNYVIVDEVLEKLSNMLKDLNNLTGIVSDFDEALSSMFYFWRTIIDRSSEE